MLKTYPEFKKGEIEQFYKSLSKKEKDIFEDYLTYRKARAQPSLSIEKIKDIKRYMLQLRYILEKDFKSTDLKDLRGLSAIIKSGRLSDYSKNEVLTDLKNLIRFLFSDWSIKFPSLDDDLRLIRITTNGRKINSKNIYKKEDIEKLMKYETKMFWKAFLITQFEGGLRTKEVRLLKWEDINFNVEGDLSELHIYATKTKEARVVFVKEATFYLNRLKEEQETSNQKGTYVFHSSRDKNKSIDKRNISVWFRNLTKKTLGREGWNYLLRHSRATELYRLAKENKIAKDIVLKFMGHADDMSEIYTHLDDSEVKTMLKAQVYRLEELPEEKKHEIEKELNELKKASVTQQNEITKVSSEVKELWGMAGKIRHVKWLVEAADKSEIIQSEFEKYIDRLPPEERRLAQEAQETLKRAK